MRAWTVDADDIRVAEDFDESLLHRTPEIDAFLTPGRDDKFVVIGTKGFGKTLLLKAKRVLYQREGHAACLPSGNLLDKPIGDKIFSRESIAVFASSPLPWSKVWLSAIAIATLKHFDALEDLKVGARLGGLVADTRLLSVIDHFVRLLDFTPSELQRCATDTDGHLVPRLRALNAPLAIFIDGIDEYFNKHVEELPASPSVTGEEFAERLVFLAARPGRGRLPAAPHQPPPEGVRGDPQGGLRALAAAHGHGPAVPRQRGRNHHLHAGGAARDLRQQRSPGADRADGAGRPHAQQPARGLPRPPHRDRRPHPRGGGRRSSMCAGILC